MQTLLPYIVLLPQVFEQVQPDLLTSAELVACYKGVPLMTSAGPVKVPSVAGASIK